MIRIPPRKDTVSMKAVYVDNARLTHALDQKGFSHVYCNCEKFVRTSWCSHIEKVYTGHRDLDCSIFAWPAQGIVIFREPFLVVQVIMRPWEQDPSLYEASAVWDGERTSSDSFSYSGSFAIGYLDTSDLWRHRAVLRNLVLEWLPAIVITHPERMSCSSSFHVGDRRIQVSSLSKDSSMQYMEALTDAYCLLERGQSCYHCQGLVSEIVD